MIPRPPALNQVELHPFFTQSAVCEYDRTSGIVTQAWSPIGGVMRYRGDDRPPEDDPLAHPTIMAIGRKYDRTPAQVILRWLRLHAYSRRGGPDHLPDAFYNRTIPD